jgi:hypothetical protein
MPKQMVVIVIERLGGDIRIIYNKVKVTTTVKVNDWGHLTTIVISI